LFNSNSSNLLGSGGVYNNNIHSDTLAQLLRSSDIIHNENSAPSPLSATSSINPYHLGDLFNNSQVFKGMPEGIYSYLNTNMNSKNNGDDADRGLPSSLAGHSYDSRFKWANNLDDAQSSFKAKANGDPSVLSLSPTDNMPNTSYSNHVGAMSNLSGSINAQGTISESRSPLSDAEKRRPSHDINIVDGDKAVKKRRRQEKNREAAQLFRQRQKAKVHELERAVDDLTCNNSEYRMKMEILAFENKILKDQLFYLKNLVSSGILITSMPSVPAFSPVAAVPNDKGDVSALMMNGNRTALPGLLQPPACITAKPPGLAPVAPPIVPSSGVTASAATVSTAAVATTMTPAATVPITNAPKSPVPAPTAPGSIAPASIQLPATASTQVVTPAISIVQTASAANTGSNPVKTTPISTSTSTSTNVAVTTRSNTPTPPPGTIQATTTVEAKSI
jgi:hypothetical protein